VTVLFNGVVVGLVAASVDHCSNVQIFYHPTLITDLDSIVNRSVTGINYSVSALPGSVNISSATKCQRFPNITIIEPDRAVGSIEYHQSKGGICHSSDLTRIQPWEQETFSRAIYFKLSRIIRSCCTNADITVCGNGHVFTTSIRKAEIAPVIDC